MAKANYTPEEVQEMTERYLEGKENPTILEEIANEMGRSVPAIRMKLVTEGVYVKKTPIKKTAKGAIERKPAIVLEIADLLGEDVALLDSLEKTTKYCLQAIRVGLKSAQRSEEE